MTTDPQPPAEHIPYEVLSIEATTDLAPGNRFEDMVVVHFQGPGGYVDSVKLPKRLYEPARVDREIEQLLDQHEAVAQLGQAPHPDNLAH